MSLVSLPQTVRSLARLRHIVQVLSKHGFGHIVERIRIGRYIPLPQWLSRPPAVPLEPDAFVSIGQRLVRVCEELGPTFIKLGQLAATRPDLLPPAIVNELARLQDRVAPFPSAQARQIIADSLGRPIDAVFSRFDDEPFASGSIAQVHLATTTAGRKVVVKVRRPGIESVIHTDVVILRWLAQAVEHYLPEFHAARPRVLIEEFAHSIQRELDFINEASLTTRFRSAFEGNPSIRVPEVYWDLTESGVLTLEFLEGVPLREVLEDTSGRFDRAATARHLAEAFMRQFFELGLFHADAHAGNVLFSPPGSIGLIDFGNASDMDDELRGRLVLALFGTIRKEVDLVIEALADAGALGENTDLSLLQRDMREMLEKYYGLPLRRLELATVFTELLEISRRNDVLLPREFVLLGRSLVAVAGVALQLDPELNLLELIRPRLTQTLREQFSTRRLARKAGYGLWHLANAVAEAPRLLRDLIRRGGRGQVQVTIRHQNLDHLVSELDRSSNRLALSITMAATFIGSSLVIGRPPSETVLTIPLRYLGVAGYVASFVMGAWLAVAILRSGKLS